MEEKDKQLWNQAKRRVSFKRHAYTYFVVNAFLWTLWFFTDFLKTWDEEQSKLPWPVWTTLGWGIGLAFHYYGAYMEDKDSAIEKEYKKLKDDKDKNQRL